MSASCVLLGACFPCAASNASTRALSSPATSAISAAAYGAPASCAMNQALASRNGALT